MTETPIFLLVFDTHQRKWAKKRISGLLINENLNFFSNLIHYNMYANSTELREKTTFALSELIFARNYI